ncbi:hypothetical protein CRYUN_Cryun10bG0096700 [Craigia yunnanensis]
MFAGEARSLEEKLGQAALGNAFLLQGCDCAGSFKEFNANNIRDTFRVLLQMGVVLMFGGQMPIIKIFDDLTQNCFCGVIVLVGGKNGRSVCKAEIRSIQGEEWGEAPKLLRCCELAHRVDELWGSWPLLDSQLALTREDSITGVYYDCSAHMLWVGERTLVLMKTKQS